MSVCIGKAIYPTNEPASFLVKTYPSQKRRCKTLNVVCSQLYDTIVIGGQCSEQPMYNTSMHFIFPFTPVIPHLLQNVNFSMKYFVNCEVYTSECGIRYLYHSLSAVPYVDR